MSIKENAAGDDGRGATPPPARPDRTHWLYIAVLVAVVAGAVLGGLFPNAGKAMAPLGTGFVNLIKMMISPVIFCTIVLGIGSVRKAASVGRGWWPRPGLLPGDEHVRAGDRPDGGQLPAAG